MEVFEDDLALSLGLAGDWFTSGLDVTSDEVKVTQGSSLTPTALQLDQPDVLPGFGPQWLDEQVDLLQLLAENSIELDNSYPDDNISNIGNISNTMSHNNTLVLYDIKGTSDNMVHVPDVSDNIESVLNVHDTNGYIPMDLAASAADIDVLGKLGLVPVAPPAELAPALAGQLSGLELLNQLVDEAAERMSTDDVTESVAMTTVEGTLDLTSPHSIDYNSLDQMADSIGDSSPISPLSADEIESLLSSAPPSPGEAERMLAEAMSPITSPIIVEPPPSVIRITPYRRVSSQSTPKSSSQEQAKILDRKLRKKQQNKDAATRYRVKKREEAKGTRSEEEVLEARNGELSNMVDQMTQEINAMKDILSQVLQAKGLTLEKALGKI